MKLNEFTEALENIYTSSASKSSTMKLTESKLTEDRWKYKLKSGVALRQAIDNEDVEGTLEALRNCYQELLDNGIIDDWDYENGIDGIEEFAFWDEEDYIENTDYELSNFFDLCDDFGIWVSMNESLKEGFFDKLKTLPMDSVVDWLFDHETAFEDACNYFNTDPNGLLNVKYFDLINWIADHDLLYDDFLMHFNLNEGKVSLRTKHLTEGKEPITSENVYEFTEDVEATLREAIQSVFDTYETDVGWGDIDPLIMTFVSDFVDTFTE